MNQNRKNRLETTLNEHVAPFFLDVKNESYMHQVPKDAETHFKITIVSDFFNSLRTIERHKKMYQLLAHELSNGLHALSLYTYTPEEWHNLDSLPSSPLCAHTEKNL